MTAQHRTAIHFIGAGNMAGAILRGLVSSGFNAGSLSCSAPNEGQTSELADELGIRTAQDNLSFLDSASAIVLGVKPQILESVCRELAEPLAAMPASKRPLLISIAAGVSIETMADWLGLDTASLALVRSMPNTPAQVGMGASGLYATTSVSEQQRSLTSSVFEAFGIAVWVEGEADLHAVTALSGSGPAYIFEVIKGLTDGGVALGLSPDVSRQLAEATVAGAAKLSAKSHDVDVATLQKRVMSPGGTTEKGVAVLQENDLNALLLKTMTAARDQSRVLAGDDN